MQINGLLRCKPCKCFGKMRPEVFWNGQNEFTPKKTHKSIGHKTHFASPNQRRHSERQENRSVVTRKPVLCSNSNVDKLLSLITYQITI